MFRFALPVALFLASFATTSVVSADDCDCADKCRMVKRFCLEKVTCEKEVTRFKLKCVEGECGSRLKLCKETCTKEVTRLKLKSVCVEKCRKGCWSMPKLMKPCCDKAEEGDAPAPEAAK
ncbi:MAG: hypothetical protein VX438_18915 [Planctomycetota bacterium]|nr:hypothetical protein [Planctomycetota bacterium]